MFYYCTILQKYLTDLTLFFFEKIALMTETHAKRESAYLGSKKCRQGSQVGGRRVGWPQGGGPSR